MTARLHLYPLSMGQLQLALDDQDLLAGALSLPIVADMAYDAVYQAMHAKVKKMAQAPLVMHRWYTYWLMILQSNPVGIGLIGFKGAPNMHGEVEIGYGISPEYEGRGYTTEAAQALVDWGLAQSECRSVRAITLKSNIASHRVLEKTGLTIDQVRDDDLIWRIWRDTAVSTPAAEGTL